MTGATPLPIVIPVACPVAGEAAARGEIPGQPGGLRGNAGALAVRAPIESACRPAASIPHTAVGIILLFAAEITWTYSHRFGSREGEPMLAATPMVPPRGGSATAAARIEGAR